MKCEQGYAQRSAALALLGIRAVARWPLAGLRELGLGKRSPVLNDECGVAISQAHAEHFF